MKDRLDRVLSIEAEAEREWIAGVPRDILLQGQYWKGFRSADEDYLFDLLGRSMEFRLRTDELEHDETWKQIGTYFLVRKEGKYLYSVRRAKGGDTRLYGAGLIGFGGHLRRGDIEGPMNTWLQREFEEEVSVGGVEDITYLGVVNDDEDPRKIGLVHFGLVFVMEVSGEVSIKEKEKFEEGVLLTPDELKEKIPEMESWSQLVAATL